jgi:hypothetical protein
MDDCGNLGEHIRAADNDKSKDTNPKDALGVKKVPMHCVSCAVMMELGLAMMEGGRKYGTHNYRKMGVRGSVYYDATMRHMMAYWEGEDIDPDSGVSHIIKAIATLVVMRDSMLMENFEDDRPIRLPNGLDIKNLNEQAAKIITKYPNCKQPFIHDGPKPKQYGKLCSDTLKDRKACMCGTCVGIRQVEGQRETAKQMLDTSRGGHDWTDDEDNRLRDEAGHLFLPAIAALHKRSELAITCRMEKLNIVCETGEKLNHDEGKVTFDDMVDNRFYYTHEVCQCSDCQGKRIAARVQENIG